MVIRKESLFLLACSVFFSGCRWGKQADIDKTTEKVPYPLIQIENLTVTEKALTLDYQVSNPLAYDIWVCEDIDIYGRYDVETRIDAETVWIKLCFNLECNVYLLQAVYAKYRRLSPGESHSERILLNLPVRNASPVYEFHENRKKHKQVVLHRAVFELGYLEGDLENVLLESIYKGKRDPTNEQLHYEWLMLGYIQNARSRNTIYLPDYWPGLSMEKSAEVVVTDVNIPCSVAIDE